MATAPPIYSPPSTGGGGGAATAVTETGGPTTLTVGAIVDGQILVRSGATLIGTAVGAGTDTFVKATGTDTTAGVLSVKLPDGGDLTWTTNTPAGNETRTAVVSALAITNAKVAAAAAINYSKLETVAALSFMANATNAAAVAAPLAVATDGHVPMRSGVTLTTGLIANANVSATAAIAYSKLTDMSAPGIIGKFAVGAGAVTTLLASAGVSGNVPTVQADGSIAWVTPSGSGFTPGAVKRITYAVTGPVQGDSADFTWDQATYTLFGQGGTLPYVKLDTTNGTKIGFSTINYVGIDSANVTVKVNNGALNLVGQAENVNLVWGAGAATSFKGGMIMTTGTAPTANPTAGYCAIWFDGTVLKLRAGATVTTFTTA